MLSIRCTLQLLGRSTRIASLLAVALSHAAAGAGSAADPLEGFEGYVAAALSDWRTPGIAIAIVRADEILLTKGYGVQEIGRPELVDEHTIFPISSVTKAFTATSLALLVEEGVLKWDDPVVQHLPEFELPNAHLTREVQLIDLLSHRTGLERGDLLFYRGDYDRPEIIRRMRFLKPRSPFRDRFGYHNLTFLVAGAVLEKASGTTWDAFIQNRVFDALRMSRSRTHYDPTVSNAVAAHILDDGQIALDHAFERARHDEAFRKRRMGHSPAGSIYSTAADLASFLKLYVNEGVFNGRPFLRAETVRSMTAVRSVLPIETKPAKSFVTRYFYGAGAGWLMRDYRGRKIVYHPGSSGAVVAYMPEENIGVAVVANRACGISFMVMHDVFDRLLGVPRDVTNADWIKEGITTPEASRATRNAQLELMRKKGTSPALPLPAYVGSYESDLYGTLEIQLEGEALHLHFGPDLHAQLKHWEDHTFRGQVNMAPGDWFVRFQVDGGSAKGVQIERIFWDEPMPTFLRTSSQK